MEVEEKISQIILEIAKREVDGLETLESRNRDELDFYDIGVVSLEKMLRQAFETGLRVGVAAGKGLADLDDL